MSDIYRDMPEEDRILYNSALQVRKSEFWQYYLDKVNQLIEINKEDTITKTLEGDEKGALIAATKARGLELAIEEMDNIIGDIEVIALNQEQEEENAKTD